MPERHPDIIAVEARSANAEGEGEISMARLVRRALRMNADRVIVGEVLGDEVLPMLNAMSQGRSGSMCTIHADSSSGVFKRLATYAVQAPERLSIESTNMLIAGAIHFIVYVEVHDTMKSAYLLEDPLITGPRFEPVRRERFIPSVREVVDAEGLQIISNEIFEPGPNGRAVPGAPLRSSTLDELISYGYEPRWN